MFKFLFAAISLFAAAGSLAFSETAHADPFEHPGVPYKLQVQARNHQPDDEIYLKPVTPNGTDSWYPEYYPEIAVANGGWIGFNDGMLDYRKSSRTIDYKITDREGAILGYFQIVHDREEAQLNYLAAPGYYVRGQAKVIQNTLVLAEVEFGRK
jgi:hypothetical protein